MCTSTQVCTFVYVGGDSVFTGISELRVCVCDCFCLGHACSPACINPLKAYTVHILECVSDNQM